MAKQASNEVYAGTYMDPGGRTHKVLGIAQHRRQGARSVIYIPSDGELAGQLLAEDVGEYINRYIQNGRFMYQGPHPRILGTNRPSPGILFKR